MASFGERLRNERETRNTTIEEISAATGIQLGYLVALESSEFHALPGRAFGKFYIRAYGKTLGFDPQPLIDQYDRERELVQPVLTGQPPDPPARPRRVEAEIARWRQAAMAERHKEEAPVEAEESFDDSPLKVQRDEVEAVVAVDEVEVAGEPTDVDFVVVSRAEPAASSRSRRPLAFGLLFIGLFLVAAGTYFTLFRTSLEGSEASAPPAPDRTATTVGVPVAPGSSAASPAAPRPAVIPPAAPRPPTRVASAEPAAPSQLKIAEFGVGRRIVDRRLADVTERFTRGEVAWFSTHLLGARRGESIRHVWFYQGRALQSIELRLGGPDWHTHSRKTLGEAGEWAVEARDRKGRVLARTAFVCEPDGS